MPELDVVNLKKEKVRTLSLDDALLSGKGRSGSVYGVVKHHQAKMHQGTKETKTKGDVAGSGSKPWRQKGTGRARVGTTRSPLWRKGGVIHGPHMGTRIGKVSRRKKSIALRLVLSEMIGEERVRVVENWDLADHKTRLLKGILDALQAPEKCLIVYEEANRNLLLASRNLPGVKALPAVAVNVYNLLDYPYLLISEGALKKLEERVKK